MGDAFPLRNADAFAHTPLTGSPLMPAVPAVRACRRRRWRRMAKGTGRHRPPRSRRRSRRRCAILPLLPFFPAHYPLPTPGRLRPSTVSELPSLRR
eukprot:6982422-Prymnesium_polylepis.1